MKVTLSDNSDPHQNFAPFYIILLAMENNFVDK